MANPFDCQKCIISQSSYYLLVASILAGYFFSTDDIHTTTISDQTDHSRTLTRYDSVCPDEYLSNSSSCTDNRSNLGSDDYNIYESNYELNNKEAPFASASTTEVVEERKINATFFLRQEKFNDKFSPKDLLNAIWKILSSSPRDMSDDKGALCQILNSDWENILKGLIITTSSNHSKCSYHILYAPVLFIDHHEFKAFTELVYTITGEKFGKYIDRGLPENGWNELNHARVQPPTSLGLKVKPRMLSVEQNNNPLKIIVDHDILKKCADLILQKYSNYLRDYIIKERDSENFETEKIYVLENLAILNNINLLVLSTCHSYSNAVITRLNLKLYCDIDGNINLPNYKRVVCQIESLHRITNNCKCSKKCKCPPIQYDLWLDEIVSIIAQAQSHLARQSIEKLYKLIQEARRIIVMDNDLIDLNIEWIKALHKDKPFSVIHNTYQPQKGKMFCLAPNKETVLSKLWDWAKKMSLLPFKNQTSALLICYLRKDIQGIVCALKTDFPELQIKKYHDKSDLVEKAHDFSNVKESWKDVDLVAYTSTLK
ncbi:hypothetical protein GLOIN_2v1792147 [Rhizophagus clarus]|uniref:Replication origin-binding protein domain-containing protein n=1 Tax=Rhizophagus clarus TaxID=94130 RepID=A0A8H3MBW5_9GLOM|nr:hypothetical protein GLOIN_2v1792147 [Rhizophagus clarus]